MDAALSRQGLKFFSERACHPGRMTQGNLMKKFIVFVVAAVLALAAQGLCQQSAPSEMAGLTLGKPIAEFGDRFDTDKALPLWDKPYLVRINVNPTKGFKAGYVLFGQCENAGRIVRVKFKYKDSSEKFFNDKLALLTTRFGKPKSLGEAEGGDYRGYRWIFGRDKPSAVALLFEHYSGEGIDVTEGNSIRLTDNKLLAEERACFEKTRDNAPEPQPAFPLFAIDDEWLLPR